MTIQQEPIASSPPERFEIIRGDVVPLSPTGDIHSIVEGRLYRALSDLEDDGEGLALVGEVGVLICLEPRTVRATDAAFYLQSQLPYETSREGYLITPPALVVEVVSPNDRLSQVQEKVWEYLAAGVKIVWVADPATHTIGIYAPDHTAQFIVGEAPLAAPGVFDTLKVTVNRIFRGLGVASMREGPAPE